MNIEWKSILTVAIALTAPLWAGEREPLTLKTGSGHFSLEDDQGREERAITVFYHRPANLRSDSRVMMVVPGAGRNGDDYRDAWKAVSEEHGVLVLSPSFPERHYPEYWSYNLAGMAEEVVLDLRFRIDPEPEEWRLDEVRTSAEGDPDLQRLARRRALLFQLLLWERADMIAGLDVEATDVEFEEDRDRWIFGDFDRIFLRVKDSLDLEAEGYDMFGHSAGGQLLHRLALFHSDSRADRILAANSGWYTVPDPTVEFPYGLGGTGIGPEALGRALRTELVVFLGAEDDADETRGSLRRTPGADRQGRHRLARGKHFFRAARAAAEHLGTDFGWRLVIVPGVGHDYRRMSRAAAGRLYGTGEDRR